MDIINYDVMSESWENGLPTGNGRLACMLWENGNKDIFSLNHEAIWTGKYKNRECECNAHFLPYVRQYLKEEKIFKATALSALAFGGNGGISPLDRRIDSYQPACDIVVSLPDEFLSRSLDISKGYAASRREHSSLRTFCSITDNCFAFEYRFDIPSVFSVSLDRALPVCQHDIPGISDQAGKEFFYTPLSEINFCPVFINKVIHSPKGLLYFLLISL